MDPLIDLHSDQLLHGRSLRQAHRAWEQEEVPVGAVDRAPGGSSSRGLCNQVETLKDATAHAEMLAITQAESVVGDWRLNECELYVTKEPCPMCAGALVHVRMKRVIFRLPLAEGWSRRRALNLLQHPSSTINATSRAGCGRTNARRCSRPSFGNAAPRAR